MASTSRLHRAARLAAVLCGLLLLLPPGASSFGGRQSALPRETGAGAARGAPGIVEGRVVPPDASAEERGGDAAAVVVVVRRRELLRSALGAAAFVGSSGGAASASFPSAAAAAEGVSVLRSKGCYRGEGEACDDLAEGNDFIRSLQRKSAENREMNDREALNAYNMKNFPDFFASLNPPKYLVRQPDGTFGVYTDAELARLKSAGKIAVENPQTKGGKFRDLTQRPMLVLVE